MNWDLSEVGNIGFPIQHQRLDRETVYVSQKPLNLSALLLPIPEKDEDREDAEILGVLELLDDELHETQKSGDRSDSKDAASNIASLTWPTSAVVAMSRLIKLPT